MGTHPIFESDFDCLTGFRMAPNLWETICAEHAEIEQDDLSDQPKRMFSEESQKLDYKNCSAATYYDRVLMPIISSGLTAMIKNAERENVFKYAKRNKFNGCNFLTEYLFNANPKRASQCGEPTTLDQIPFCIEFDKNFPRKQLPLSLRLTEDEAATMIQAWYRGVKTRQRDEIKE